MKTNHTLPRTLSHKNIYVLPTRHGLLFIVVLLGMLSGSMNYNNNMGFLLTFLLGGMGLQSLWHTYKNLEGIRLLSVRARPVFAGEAAVFEVTTRAGSHMRAAVMFKFSTGEGASTDLQTDTDHCIPVAIPTRKRGLCLPGPLTLTSRYPLGLFFAWSRIHVDTECVVYPRPVPGKAEFPRSNSQEDDDTGDNILPGAEDFQDLRSYQPGDPLGRISWKAYSRGQGLFVKNFVGTSGASVILDWHVIPFKDTERKLSALCEGVLSAHRTERAYGLNLPGTSILPNKGGQHRHLCLKALALFELPGEAL